MTIVDNKATGNKGEEIACSYLRKHGYEILERNFLIRGGEIDIIAEDDGYLVFVEVKTRYSHDFGLPVESITPWKIKHLLKTAQIYLMKINYGNGPYRLDFIGVDFAEDADNPNIELIKNITF
jgi:putative endonuclease